MGPVSVYGFNEEILNYITVYPAQIYSCTYIYIALVINVQSDHCPE